MDGVFGYGECELVEVFINLVSSLTQEGLRFIIE